MKRTNARTIESWILSVRPVLEKQTDVSRAALRLTGQLPNTEYYRVMFMHEERGRIQLEDRFASWKTREAPFVMSRTLIDTFKRQWQR